MRRVLTHVVATIAVFTTLGVARGPNTMEGRGTGTPTVQRVAAQRTSTHKKPFEVGPASWYGKFFHGKQTASGEPYDMYEMTAAHPDLPLGTKVKVTNLKNAKTVVVRVNDRGPMVPGRIIDLSYGAAQQLGFTAKGVQKVRLDLVPAQTVESARLQ